MRESHNPPDNARTPPRPPHGVSSARRRARESRIPASPRLGQPPCREVSIPPQFGPGLWLRSAALPNTHCFRGEVLQRILGNWGTLCSAHIVTPKFFSASI